LKKVASVSIDQKTLQMLLLYAACRGKDASAVANEAIKFWWESWGISEIEEVTGKRVTLKRMKLPRKRPAAPARNLLPFPNLHKRIALPLVAIITILMLGRVTMRLPKAQRRRPLQTVIMPAPDQGIPGLAA
jgi:hypothetical protein